MKAELLFKTVVAWSWTDDVLGYLAMRLNSSWKKDG